MQVRSVAWVVLVGCAAAAPASADPLVKPPAQDALELSNQVTAQHVAVPLTPEAGAEITSASASSVALGGRPMPSLVGSFTGIAASSRSLAFDVRLDSLREPGTYTASFLLSGLVLAKDGKTPV